MKKTTKRIVTVFAVFVGLLILIAGGFFLRFYFGTRDMAPANTGHINDSVFSVKDKFVNAFLFKGKPGYLMIDAGMDEETIKTELCKLGIEPAQVTDILLTHTDTDHTGAIGLFKNAKVYMHRDEEQMINGQNGKFFFLRLKWKYGAYTLFNSDDTLILAGIKVKVFHTPGHTPGSCSFLIGTDYLATGDNLAYKEGRFSHFVDFFNMDTKLQENSIKTLPSPDTMKYVLTAHFGVISRGKQVK